MNSSPRVSIIIPVYNMGAYLEECLASVLQQSLAEIELICVNDGSTDHSLDILTRISRQDSRVKVIDKKNKGVSAARNDAILAASGEFLYFLDPDDRIPYPDTLETLYTKAIASNCQICGGEIAIFKPESSDLSQQFVPELDGYTFKAEGNIRFTDYQFDYGFQRFIYSREMVLKHRIFFPPYSFFEDPPFMVRCMLCAGSFYALPQITYAYRIGHHGINWTPQKTEHLYSGLQDVWQQAKDHQLQRLSRYVWYHLRSFYIDTLPHLTPEQKQFAQEVDNTARPTSNGWLRWFFCKEKYFLNKRMRRFTILGIKFTKNK